MSGAQSSSLSDLRRHRLEGEATFEKSQAAIALKRVVDGQLLATLKQLDTLQACNDELLQLCKEHGPAAQAVSMFVEVCTRLSLSLIHI